MWAADTEDATIEAPPHVGAGRVVEGDALGAMRGGVRSERSGVYGPKVSEQSKRPGQKALRGALESAKSGAIDAPQVQVRAQGGAKWVGQVSSNCHRHPSRGERQAYHWNEKTSPGRQSPLAPRVHMHTARPGELRVAT